MALEIKNVNRTFEGSEKETLKDISLHIEEGEFVCIVGPSGCGKSTLLNIVAGLDHPTDGELYLDGEKITGPGADRVVMFQEHALFPWLNVLENVKFGMRMMGIPKEEQNRRAEHYLKMVQLWDFRNYRIHEISGGMRQRTALARALCLDGPVLLMDEPFSALDEFTREKLHIDLLKIWRKTNKTVIFVTHNISESVFLSDRVCVLSPHPGRLSAVVDIDLPRPRTLDMTDTQEFTELVARVRGSFEGV